MSLPFPAGAGAGAPPGDGVAGPGVAGTPGAAVVPGVPGAGVGPGVGAGVGDGVPPVSLPKVSQLVAGALIPTALARPKMNDC